MLDVSRILFATDFSDMSVRSLAWAKRMAAIFDADLHCVYVVEEPLMYGGLDMGAVPLPTSKELGEIAEKSMQKFAKEHFGSSDGDVKFKVLSGRAEDEIVQYGIKNDMQMIVMSTHGYSGINRVVMGSTTEAVLRHAECPVLAVPVE